MGPRFWVLLSALFLSILIGGTANAASTCERSLLQSSRLMTVSFDFARYEKERQRFAAAFSSTRPLPPDSTMLESEIAWLEVATEKRWIDPGSTRISRRLARAVRRMNFDKTVSLVALEEALRGVYSAAYGSMYPSILQRIRGGDEAAIDSVARRIIEERLAKKGIEGALAQLGLLRSPTFIESARAWMSGKTIRMVLTAILNLPVVETGFPVYLPDLERMRWLDFSDEVLSRMMKDGFDAVWPGIRDGYRGTIRSDLNYQNLRRVYLFVAGAIFAYVVYDRIATLGDLSESDSDTEVQQTTAAVREQSARLQEQQTTQTLGQELFEDWKRQFQEKNGRPPDASEEQSVRKVLEFHQD